MALTDTERQTLADERANDPQSLGLPGCSTEILQSRLNAEGSSSTDTLVLPSRPVIRTKADILRQLSNDSIAAFRNWMDAEANADAVAIRELWDAYSQIDMSDSRVQQMAQSQGSDGYATWTDSEVDMVCALGKVGQSRAQELIGRNITLDEAQEVING